MITLDDIKDAIMRAFWTFEDSGYTHEEFASEVINLLPSPPVYYSQPQPSKKPMTNIKKHIQMLGLRVEDKVTGQKGVVSSVSFDLYGCVQAIVNPGMDKDGKLQDQIWFDVSRLKVLSEEPVMDRPDFDFGPQAEGKQGPAEKPKFFKA